MAIARIVKAAQGTMMRSFKRLIGALRAIIHRGRIEAELDEELQEYLAAAADAKVAAGLPSEKTRRLARAELGNPAAVKEWVREVGWESRLESVAQDVRYALRILGRSPGFASVAILTFALGIGANTAVFSIVDATLLKPLPFQHADRLVDILEIRRPGTAEEASYSGMDRRRLEEWRTQTHIFDVIEAVKSPRPITLGGTGGPIRVAQVSGGVFPMLGLSPILGRHFSHEEAASGDHRLLLISEGLWKRAFGASPGIVGREIILDTRTVAIIGVMPREARFPIGPAVDAWLPLTATVDPKDPASGLVGVVARLREGLTLTSAQPELARAAETIQSIRPSREPWTARVEPIDPRRWRTGSAPIVLTAFAAVAIVLLTACANIANLLMARASARQREMAIRGAIGASRGRLVRQLLVENVVLALLGGITAITLAAWLIPAIPALLPPRFIGFPVHDAVLDWRVLFAAISGSFLAGALSGVLPALRGSKSEVVSSLGVGGITAPPVQRRTRNLLVGAQVAFACVLLVGAGLMTSSFVRMVASDPGYRIGGLNAVSVSVPAARYASAAQRTLFYNDLADRARATHGVSAVTLGTPPPRELAGSLTAEDRQTDPDSRVGAALLAAAPDYFDVLGIPILSGRAFSSADREGSPPVAVIDEDTARRFWPGQSALGKRVRYSPYVPWMTVVGVAGNVKTSRAGSAVQSFELYMPVSQAPFMSTVMFRAGGSEASVLAAIRAHIEALDPDATISSAGTMRDLYGPSLINPRFSAFAMSTFAVITLVTAAIGLYGMLMYTVSRRTPEIGLRIALGASASEVTRLIVAEALAPVVSGLVIGMAAAQVLSRAIAAQLYQMTPHDPLTLAVVVMIFAAVATAAAYLPARRATRVDPLVALRAE